MKPEPKRAPRVPGTTPSQPPPPQPTTPFESWVVAQLEDIRGDVHLLTTNVERLLHHFGLVSGDQP